MYINKSIKRINICIVYYKHELNLIALQRENKGNAAKCLLLIYA